jgi:hypothetical protein
MSFQLSHTPTLEAVAVEDEKQLAQDLDARVAEVIQAVGKLQEVAAAIEASAAAGEHLRQLRTAERALNQQAKQAREQAEKLSAVLVQALVEAAARNGKPDARKISSVTAAENLVRYTARAIERLTEHSIPVAEIASLREEAHALMAEARATERTAQERAEKVLGQIRDAVSGEMVLPVDMSKGVAGALLARARSLKTRAVQVSEAADQIERAYQDRYEHS